MNGSKLHIGLAGNLVIGRELDRKISHNSYLSPWGDVLPLLKSNDLNIVNLESLFTTASKPVRGKAHHKAALDKARTLTGAKINFVSLANDHALDFHEEGLLENIRVLDRYNIKHAGAGKDDVAARRPVLIDIDNTRLGIIAVTDTFPDWKAAEDKPGINYLDIDSEEEREKFYAEVTELRKGLDLLLASIDWRIEMQDCPPESYIAFARGLVDSGVDIVHGHSAGITHAFELYKQKLILYSTGNFLGDNFDLFGRKSNNSALFMLEIQDAKLIRLKIVPVTVKECKLFCAKDDDYDWSMQQLEKLCERFDVHIQESGEVEIVGEL